MSSFDKNLITSIYKYKSYVLNLRDSMCSLYFRYEKNKPKLKEILVNSKAYTSNGMTVQNFEKRIFFILDDELGVSFSNIKNWEKISKYMRINNE